MKTKMRLLIVGGLALALSGLSGCVSMWGQRSAQGTSVMQYLYPKEPDHIEFASVPTTLSLPLRVGIAFVPRGGVGGHWVVDSDFSEQKKQELMATVAAEFRALPYVAAIELIPSTYLRPGGGFENLKQVKAMFGVDVVALVAYDQVQFTSENMLSLAYWTIVGAYVVKGERNDTQTLMETVVMDVTSRRMLFRAPGTSQVKASSTAVGHADALRRDSEAGFDAATMMMIDNLKAELDAFRERLKTQPEEFKVVHKPGYTGAGAFGPWGAVAVVGLIGVAAWRRRGTGGQCVGRVGKVCR